MSKKYTFREITEKDELEQLFRLRYQVYANSELAPFLKVNKYQIDIDIYDLHSRFFGIYCDHELAGGVRAVIDKRDYYNLRVYEIGHKCKLFNEEKNSQEKLVNTNYADFPFLSYTGIPEEIKRFYENQRKDKKVYMSSRCVIDDKHRGLKTIQFLTESIILIGLLLCGDKVGLAVTDGSIRHTKFFSRYGFSTVEDAPSYCIYDIPVETIFMHLSTNPANSYIPEYFHSKFEKMMVEYKSTGKIDRVL